MWQQNGKYHLQNGNSTICKVWLNGKLTYELWHNGTQYIGFKNAEEAKLRYEELK